LHLSFSRTPVAGDSFPPSPPFSCDSPFFFEQPAVSFELSFPPFLTSLLSARSFLISLLPHLPSGGGYDPPFIPAYPFPPLQPQSLTSRAEGFYASFPPLFFGSTSPFSHEKIVIFSPPFGVFAFICFFHPSHLDDLLTLFPSLQKHFFFFRGHPFLLPVIPVPLGFFGEGTISLNMGLFP